MELYHEILINALKNQDIHVMFPNLQLNGKEIVENECYMALRKIKNILANDELDDKECFAKIEEIVCVFEEIGSDGGNRHDFG